MSVREDDQVSERLAPGALGFEVIPGDQPVLHLAQVGRARRRVLVARTTDL